MQWEATAVKRGTREDETVVQGLSIGENFKKRTKLRLRC